LTLLGILLAVNNIDHNKKTMTENKHSFSKKQSIGG